MYFGSGSLGSGFLLHGLLFVVILAGVLFIIPSTRKIAQVLFIIIIFAGLMISILGQTKTIKRTNSATEQSAAPLPPAPRTGQSEGAH